MAVGCVLARTDDDSQLIQWTVKKRGKTVTVYLNAEQVSICQQWIENNKRARTLMTQMQALALRIAQLHGIPLK